MRNPKGKSRIGGRGWFWASRLFKKGIVAMLHIRVGSVPKYFVRFRSDRIINLEPDADPILSFFKIIFIKKFFKSFCYNFIKGLP